MAERVRANPAFRQKYATNMREVVGQSLKTRIQDRAFRAAWKEKAKKGSKKGLGRIRQLMQDPSFLRAWREKCRKGGNAAHDRCLGIHVKENAAARKQGSIRGLQHTGRKVIGPCGESMYNVLEKKVASILKKQGVPYRYEERFDTDEGNGFCSIDFTAGNLFIEVTDWDDAREKSRKLNRKYRMLKHQLPRHAAFVVVTKPGRVEQYRRHLEKDIRVVHPRQLTVFLAQIAG
ncbi:hypothetical protein HYV43_05205 [Candidatus Micrarchaeota archaeon]|nr:hypothetical protein [Candidatus Micrarchaeota archaeon]